MLHDGYQHRTSDYIHSHSYAIQIVRHNLFEVHFIVVPHVLGLPKWCFHFGGFATKTCIFPKKIPFRATCSAHLILYKGDKACFFLKKIYVNIEYFPWLRVFPQVFAQIFPLTKIKPTFVISVCLGNVDLFEMSNLFWFVTTKTMSESFNPM